MVWTNNKVFFPGLSAAALMFLCSFAATLVKMSSSARGRRDGVGGEAGGPREFCPEVKLFTHYPACFFNAWLC